MIKLLILLVMATQLNAANLEPLLKAIRTHESNGNNFAVGDGGRAKGPFQIHRSYWQDACAYGGLKYNYDRHVNSPAVSRKVVILYWQRYAGKAYRTGNYEVLARIHNGGLKGHLKSSTKSYWRKVMRHIK